MIIAYNITATAMNSFEEYMWNISQNIANANTTAYKARNVQLENNFPFLLSDAITDHNDTGFDSKGRKRRVYEVGTGVDVADVTTDVRQGSIENTGRMFDMAISGEGYFKVRRANGKIAYTRNGVFQRNKDGLLTDLSGNILEPRVQVPLDIEDVVIDREGRITGRIAGGDVTHEFGQVMLSVFPNPAELQAIGQNLYIQTVDSGEPRALHPFRQNAGQVIHQSIEASNVNVVEQMMKLVVNQRSFEITSKAFLVTDAILKAGM